MNFKTQITTMRYKKKIDCCYEDVWRAKQIECRSDPTDTNPDEIRDEVGKGLEHFVTLEIQTSSEDSILTRHS